MTCRQGTYYIAHAEDCWEDFGQCVRVCMRVCVRACARMCIYLLMQVMIVYVI